MQNLTPTAAAGYRAVTSNAAGSTISNVATVTPTPLGTAPASGSFYGALNRSGAVDASDLLIIKAHLAGNLPQGMSPFTASLAATDLNGDNAIDALDMSLMGSFAAGLITCLPQVPEVGAFAAPEIAGSAFGNVRAEQPMANPTQYFFYTPEMNLLSQTVITAGGTRPEIAVDYLWFNGHPVATEEIQTNTTRFTFTDHLGTPFMQTDETASVTWRAEYEPFGAVYTMRAGHAADQRLRFPGQEYDEQTPERAYNIYRWYRPGRGAYTQSDPAGFRGGLNLFQYVSGNSLRWRDPLGLGACMDILKRLSSGPSKDRQIAVDFVAKVLENCANHAVCQVSDPNTGYSGAFMYFNKKPKTAFGFGDRLYGEKRPLEDFVRVNAWAFERVSGVSGLTQEELHLELVDTIGHEFWRQVGGEHAKDLPTARKNAQGAVSEWRRLDEKNPKCCEDNDPAKGK